MICIRNKITGHAAFFDTAEDAALYMWGRDLTRHTLFIACAWPHIDYAQLKTSLERLLLAERDSKQTTTT